MEKNSYESHEDWIARNEKINRREEFVNAQQDKGVGKLLQAYFHDKALEDPNSIFEKYIPEYMREDLVKYCNNRTGGRYKYIMFTVNFRDDVLLPEIQKKTNKCISKRWIEKYMYCFETRNDKGDGIHLHLKVWLKKDKRPYECKREVYNTFKNLVGNKMHVNVKYSNTDGCFEKYIEGYKLNDVKPNRINDKEWRKINNLADVYTG